MNNSLILLFLLSPFTAFIPILWMLYHFYRERVVIQLNPLNLGLFLLCLWALFSGLMNRDLLSMAGAFGILIYLVFTLYLQQQIRTVVAIDDLLDKVWTLGLFSGLIGLIEKGLSYSIDMTWFSRLFWTFSYVPTEENYRIISTFGNPNVAGDLFAGLFLISLYLGFKRQKGRTLRYFASSVAFMVLVALTGSKGAMAAVLLSLLAYALFTRSNRNRTILMVLFISVIGVAIAVPELSHSLNSRTEIWRKCYRLFAEQPLMGWGLFGIYRQIGEVHGHNMLITILTTLGTVGLAIFGGIQLYLIHCMRVLKHRGVEILAVLVALQVQILAHGLLDFTVMLPQVGVLYFSAMALTSSLAARYIRVPEWRFSFGTAMKLSPTERFAPSSLVRGSRSSKISGSL